MRIPASHDQAFRDIANHGLLPDTKRAERMAFRSSSEAQKESEPTAMQTYEEALQARSGCDDEAIPCANCGHMDFEHDPESLRCRECKDCLRFEPGGLEAIFETEGTFDE